MFSTRTEIVNGRDLTPVVFSIPGIPEHIFVCMSPDNSRVHSLSPGIPDDVPKVVMEDTKGGGCELFVCLSVDDIRGASVFGLHLCVCLAHDRSDVWN